MKNYLFVKNNFLAPRVHCFSLKKVCNKFSLAMKLFEIICFFLHFYSVNLSNCR